MSFWAAFANMMMANRDAQEKEQLGRDTRMKSYLGGSIGEPINRGTGLSGLVRLGAQGAQQLGQSALHELDARNAQDAAKRADDLRAPLQGPEYRPELMQPQGLSAGAQPQNAPQSSTPYYLARPETPHDPSTAPRNMAGDAPGSGLQLSSNMEPYDLYQTLYGARAQQQGLMPGGAQAAQGAPQGVATEAPQSLRGAPPQTEQQVPQYLQAAQPPQQEPPPQMFTQQSAPPAQEPPRLFTQAAPLQPGQQPYIPGQPYQPSMRELFQDAFQGRVASADELQMFNSLMAQRTNMQQAATQAEQVRNQAAQGEIQRREQALKEAEYTTKYRQGVATRQAISDALGIDASQFTDKMVEKYEDAMTAPQRLAYEKQKKQNEAEIERETEKLAQPFKREMEQIKADAIRSLKSEERLLKQEDKRDASFVVGYHLKDPKKIPSPEVANKLRDALGEKAALDSNIDTLVELVTKNPLKLSPDAVAAKIDFYTGELQLAAKSPTMHNLGAISGTDKVFLDDVVSNPNRGKEFFLSIFNGNKRSLARLNEFKKSLKTKLDAKLKANNFEPDLVEIKPRGSKTTNKFTPETAQKLLQSLGPDGLPLYEQVGKNYE